MLYVYQTRVKGTILGMLLLTKNENKIILLLKITRRGREEEKLTNQLKSIK